MCTILALRSAVSGFTAKFTLTIESMALWLDRLAHAAY
jgi:hypothetical protein